MVNNLKYIIPYLKWETEDDFYYVAVLQRKKDNSGINRNSNIISSYQITSITHLKSLIDEFVTLSKLYNGRTYINLNRKSFKKTAYGTLKKLSNQLCSNEFKNVQNTYQKVSGGNVNNGDQYWILDIDDAFKTDLDMIRYIDEIEPNRFTNKSIGTVHTKTGYHLITKPFRIDQFKKKYPDVEIKKNSLTILYIP